MDFTSAPPLTREILLTLGIGVGALVLFVQGRLRMEVVGLLAMAALIVSGLVTPQEGISGFANEATITVAAMFVLSAGLLRTGAVEILGRWMARMAGKSELRLLVVSCLLVIPLSAVINNTPVVVVMIPMVLGLTRDMGVSPSRLFMPISFAGQMGGTLTLIGTSTNLLVAGIVLELGLERIGLFTITGPALVLTVVGMAYLFTVGRWLTPTRDAPADVMERYELRDYMSVLVVEEGSPVSGRSLKESRFAEEHGLEIVEIQRGDRTLPTPGAASVLHEGDHLLVHGKIPDIARIDEIDHLRIAEAEPGLHMSGSLREIASIADGDGDRERGSHCSGDGEGGDGDEEEGGGPGEEATQLAEVIVPPRSPVVGRTIGAIGFRARYGVPVIAAQRHGQPLHERLREMVLEPGDILLVQATPEQLRTIHVDRDLALLGVVDPPPRRLRKLKYSVSIIIAVVVLAAFGVTTILVAALVGSIAMFITGCLTPDEAYEEVDWMVIVLLGSLIPLGIAMETSGAAELVAWGMLLVTVPLGLTGVLAAMYLVTSLLTSLISNNAAALVLTPIAVAVALALEASPLPFLIAVMLAASNSFLTPIGYQTNTFIYGPGGYRFGDFFRVGAPLSILLLVTATLVIPLFFPFHP